MANEIKDIDGVELIEGGWKRELEDGRTVYLFPRMYNILVAMGQTGDDGWDDGY